MTPIKKGTLQQDEAGNYFIVEGDNVRPVARGTLAQDEAGNYFLVDPAEKNAPTEPEKDVASMSKTQGAIQTFGQGASFGWADEGYGALSSIIEMAQDPTQEFSWENFKRNYSANVEHQRDKIEKFRDEHGGLAAATEIGGGISTGLGLSKIIPALPGMSKVLSNMNMIPKSMLAGAGGGGVAGGGYAEGDDKLGGAGSGAVFGATLGAAIPIGVKGATYLGKKGMDALSAIFKPFATPDKQAAATIIKYMQRDGLSTDDIINQMKMLGDDAVLADVDGANLQGLARMLSKTPGASKEIIQKFLKERQRMQGLRLDRILIDELSPDTATIKTIQALQHQRLNAARPYYQKAYQTQVPMTDELESILNRGVVKKAMNRSMELLDDAGDSYLPVIGVTDKGVEAIGKVPTFQRIDMVKRGLDNIIENNNKLKGDATLGRIALQTKKELLKIADDLSPDYKKARAIYSSSYDNQRAVELGRKVLSKDWDVTADMVSRMSKSEKEHFIKGVARSLRDKMEARVDMGNKANLFNKAKVRKQIASAFDDRESLERFLSKMDAEAQKASTYQRMFNSTTYDDIMINQDINGIRIPGSPTQAVLDDLLKDLTSMNEPTREQLALMMTGAKGLPQVNPVNAPERLMRIPDILPKYTAPAASTMSNLLTGAGYR